jgi:hypothetical protein
MNPEPKPAAEASMAELMTQLSSQTSRLVRDEMRLAQKEFVESAKHAGIGAGLFSAAGLARRYSTRRLSAQPRRSRRPITVSYISGARVAVTGGRPVL